MELLIELLAVGTFASVTSILDSKQAFEKSIAPPPLKLTRLALSLSSIAHYTFLGAYSIYTLGEEGLSHLLLDGGNPAYIISNLPTAFIISVTALELAKMCYRISTAIATDSDRSTKAFAIIRAILNFSVMAALFLSPILLPSPLPPYLLFTIAIRYFSSVSILSELNKLYEKIQLNKVIYWDYSMSRISFCFLILMVNTGLIALTLNNILLINGIASVIAALYFMNKTISDKPHENILSWDVLSSVCVTLLQAIMGIVLLTQTISNPLLLLFAVLISPILIYHQTNPSETAEWSQHGSIKYKTTVLMRAYDTSNNSVSDYLTQKYNCVMDAKKNVWKDTPKTSYSYGFWGGGKPADDVDQATPKNLCEI